MQELVNVLPLKVTGHGFINYSYILLNHSDKTTAIIDPAWNLSKIDSALKDSSGGLDFILLTHAHYDHVNLVEALVKKYQSKVYISEKEADFYNYLCPNLVTFRHNEVIPLGSSPIKALVTPGHTAGGSCFLVEKNLFTGDTLFIEGCGMCNCPGGSAEAMYQSLQMLQKQIPVTTLVYPGHSYGKSPGNSFQNVLNNNIYFQFDNQADFTAFRMRENQRNLLNFK